MFGAMFGAAMFGDGDDDEFNEMFMGKRLCKVEVDLTSMTMDLH